jgi:oxygen-dependent protoporphyrinogen oxidase
VTVVVVGGGISGLLCAWELSARGQDVRVIEADRVGGSVRSADLGNFVADVGAEAYSVVRPEAAMLIARLGLESVSPRRSDARLVLTDVTAPIPTASVLGIPSDPAAADVQVFLNAVEVARALADADIPLPQSLPASLGELVRMRMGSAVVERLVDPVVRGVHAVRADDIDVDMVAPGLRAAMHRTGSLASGVRTLLEQRSGSSGVAGSAVRSVPGGMTRVVDALSEKCGAEIIAGSSALSVVRQSNVWTITTDQGIYAAEQVILALPCTTAGTLLEDAALADHLSQVRLGDVVVVALRVRSRALSHEPVGSGALVDRPDVKAKGLTQASAKWDWIRAELPEDEHVVRLSYGRDGEDPWHLLGSDPVATAVADLVAVTGASDVELLASEVQPWPQSLSHPSPEHAQWRARLAQFLERAPGLQVVGPGISGNGIAGAVASVADMIARWETM